MRTNPQLSHALLAKLCHDTAERYKAMETDARKLCEGGAQRAGVGAYVLAHVRYKQLYFLGMAYALIGLDRVQSDPSNLGYGLRNLYTAKELFDKASMAANKFVESARSLVFVDNLTILHGLNDCQAACDDAIGRAKKENDTVYFRPIPDLPDALPDRMSNLSAEPFADIQQSSVWTVAAVQGLDPSKAPKLFLGRVPETVDCCPTS